MDDIKGTYTLGPQCGRVLVKTARTGLAAKAGHDLTLEAFNTDGLRSLITTMKGRISNMKEKTLRFPGHIGYIRELQETGKPCNPDTWKPGEDQD